MRRALNSTNQNSTIVNDADYYVHARTTTTMSGDDVVWRRRAMKDVGKSCFARNANRRMAIWVRDRLSICSLLQYVGSFYLRAATIHPTTAAFSILDNPSFAVHCEDDGTYYVETICEPWSDQHKWLAFRASSYSLGTCTESQSFYSINIAACLKDEDGAGEPLARYQHLEGWREKFRLKALPSTMIFGALTMTVSAYLWLQPSTWHGVRPGYLRKDTYQWPTSSSGTLLNPNILYSCRHRSSRSRVETWIAH